MRSESERKLRGGKRFEWPCVLCHCDHVDRNKYCVRKFVLLARKTFSEFICQRVRMKTTVTTKAKRTLLSWSDVYRVVWAILLQT